jgi:hypothetical protein
MLLVLYQQQITIEKAHHRQSDALMLFYAPMHTTLLINKCSLFLLYPNTAVQLIFLRGKFQVSFVCVKLFHSPTWLYKSIINVLIRLVRFCVSCTYFLFGVCVGRMNGTHEGIYTVGLRACFFFLVKNCN